jgi:hypothetical protein
MIYGAIGAEPWLYPYDNSRFYRSQTGKVYPHTPGTALATPLVLGPGWYKGFPVYYAPPEKDRPMRLKPRSAAREYAGIADLMGPPRAILPVKPPIGGTRDPHGPVYAASYIPKGLPIIQPSKGWRIGPQVSSAYTVGEVVGDDPSPVPMRIYGSGDYMHRYANNTGFPSRAYGDVTSNLAMPTIVQGVPLRVPLMQGMAPYMVPVTGYGAFNFREALRSPFVVPTVVGVVLLLNIFGGVANVRRERKRSRR